LRSALDHIFKAVSIAHEIENCDYELKEAKEHMKRAGYDALELLSGSLGSSVISKIHPYDTETLTSVFPEYYTFIKPKISEIQLIVSQLRMGRKIDCDDTFFAYFNLIKELVEINSVIDKRIPSLQEYKEKKTKERLKKQIWQYCIGPIIGFISAALIAGLTWFFT